LLAATLDGVFIGDAAGTHWRAVTAAPSWWGPLVGFAFVPVMPAGVLAISHERMVAVRSLAGGTWTPLEPEGALTDQSQRDPRALLRE
jgi:hypothetical protein